MADRNLIFDARHLVSGHLYKVRAHPLKGHHDKSSNISLICRHAIGITLLYLLTIFFIIFQSWHHYLDVHRH